MYEFKIISDLKFFTGKYKILSLGPIIEQNGLNFFDFLQQMRRLQSKWFTYIFYNFKKNN